MKTKSMSGMSILACAIAFLAPTSSRADDIEAFLTFRGSVVNNPGRQTVQGVLYGKGEYDPIDSTANIRASLRTAPGQRPVEYNVLGNYPVLLSFRATAGDEVETDNFKGTAILYRRSMSIRGYGKIVFNRPIDPRRAGRQLIVGRGRFEFDE